MKIGDLVEIHSEAVISSSNRSTDFSPSERHSFGKGVVVETNSYNSSQHLPNPIQKLVVVVCDSGERLTCYSHHLELLSASR